MQINKKLNLFHSIYSALKSLSALAVFMVLQSCVGSYANAEYQSYDDYLRAAERYYGQDGSRITVSSDGTYQSLGRDVAPVVQQEIFVQRDLPSVALQNPLYSKTKDDRGHRPGPKKFKTIIIDAGHGGHDSGAVAAGMLEKHYALDMARKLRNALSNEFQIVMLRNEDRFIDLDRRVSMTFPYDSAILISIHLNHSPSTEIRGPETYYFRVDSYGLAKRIQRAMERVSPVQKGNVGLKRRRLRLTRNTQIPSVLLEFGYLSNFSERQLFRSSEYRQRMANAVADAIRTQNRIGDQGMGTLPRHLNRPLSRATDKGTL